MPPDYWWFDDEVSNFGIWLEADGDGDGTEADRRTAWLDTLDDNGTDLVYELTMNDPTLTLDVVRATVEAVLS